MKKAAAYLTGTYRRADLPFYRALGRGRHTIAVDGGYRFFRAAGLQPDVLLGDFDSLGRMPQDLPTTTVVLRFPSRKDKTDAHLAVDYCLSEGIGEVLLVMPDCGDIDHALGTILLAGLGECRRGKRRLEVRVINREFEICLVENGVAAFRGRAGDTVSVIPLQERIELTTSGTEYDVRRATLRLGETRGLRNRIVRARASVRVKGKALVVQVFSRRGR